MGLNKLTMKNIWGHKREVKENSEGGGATIRDYVSLVASSIVSSLSIHSILLRLVPHVYHRPWICGYDPPLETFSGLGLDVEEFCAGADCLPRVTMSTV